MMMESLLLLMMVVVAAVFSVVLVVDGGCRVWPSQKPSFFGFPLCTWGPTPLHLYRSGPQFLH